MATEKDFEKFLEAHEKIIIPLYSKLTNAMWDSEVTGNPKSYGEREKLSNLWDQIYSSKKHYEFLKNISEEKVSAPWLRRQLVLLKNAFEANQLPKKVIEELNKRSTKLSMEFNTFRGTVDGKKVTQNDIEKALDQENDSNVRRKYWEAQKAVGAKVSNNLIELVKLRNSAAEALGYDNYYTMSLKLQEIDPKWLNGIFDNLFSKTEKAFIKVKGKIDRQLAKRFRVSIDDLMPWHYSDAFFQKNPISGVSLNKYYKNLDIVYLATRFYQGIGLPIDQILAKSDLYEKERKCPHAFCITMDYKDDVRILMNAMNNAEQMGTMLHESGHAVYYLGTNKKLPFLLRDAAHIFTTEAIAMMFGKLSFDGRWMKNAMGLTEKEGKKLEKKGKEINRADQLILSRWMQVMVNFEKGMYENPDQDLNGLWWNLVEKYQHIKKPEGRDKPDYASKIHLSISPVYYHNYQLGELMASQLHNYILDNIGHYNGNKNVGKYLRERVFFPGASMRWDALVKYSTGKDLGIKDFVKQYC
ncbi:MAG: M2 family metallopeptidase [Nanoarchaeota archaeon]|nr:M2 family metallopeptidase [Nanoarchaeota archaeon]